MTVTAVFLLDAGLRRHWDIFIRDRPHLAHWVPVNCADADVLGAGLENVGSSCTAAIVTVTTAYLIDHSNREFLADSARTVLSDLMKAVRSKSDTIRSCNFFIAAPVRVLFPRWYYNSFPTMYKIFQQVMQELPPNIFVLPYHEVFAIYANLNNGRLNHDPNTNSCCSIDRFCVVICSYLLI